MRSIYEMPTVQEFCCQFSAAVEETLKRINNCGFSYFTSRDSYYDVPEGMFSFKEIPTVPCPVARKGSSEDVAKITRWTTTYGDSTRQLSVREKSTKDNPGTLPISPYGRRTLLKILSKILSKISLKEFKKKAKRMRQTRQTFW